MSMSCSVEFFDRGDDGSYYEKVRKSEIQPEYHNCDSDLGTSFLSCGQGEMNGSRKLAMMTKMGAGIETMLVVLLTSFKIDRWKSIYACRTGGDKCLGAVCTVKSYYIVDWSSIQRGELPVASSGPK